LDGSLVGGLIGGILGAFGAYFASMHQFNMVTRTKFRAAFLPTLHLLKPLGIISEQNHCEALKKTFLEHSIAVAQLKPTLNLGCREAFIDAWQKYYSHDGNKDAVNFEQYSEYTTTHIPPGAHEKQQAKNELAYERLLSVIKFVDD